MERLRAIAVLLVIVLFGTGAVAGALSVLDRLTARRDRIVVGSKAFTESVILAEITAQWLETNGVPVDRRFYLGATNISFAAIRSSAVDVYPEYTGTALTAILDRPPMSDRAQVRSIIDAEFSQRYGIDWLARFGFDNTYALAVPDEIATRLHL